MTSSGGGECQPLSPNPRTIGLQCTKNNYNSWLSFKSHISSNYDTPHSSVSRAISILSNEYMSVGRYNIPQARLVDLKPQLSLVDQGQEPSKDI